MLHTFCFCRKRGREAPLEQAEECRLATLRRAIKREVVLVELAPEREVGKLHRVTSKPLLGRPALLQHRLTPIPGEAPRDGNPGRFTACSRDSGPGCMRRPRPAQGPTPARPAQR